MSHTIYHIPEYVMYQYKSSKGSFRGIEKFRVLLSSAIHTDILNHLNAYVFTSGYSSQLDLFQLLIILDINQTIRLQLCNITDESIISYYNQNTTGTLGGCF